MEWVKPIYSRKEVNEAGEYLVREEDYDEGKIDYCIDTVDNFRAAHAFPLNTLQIRLRSHAKSVDTNSVVAQRLKRL